MADRQVTTESVKAIAALLGIERDGEYVEELAAQVRSMVQTTGTLDSMDLTPYEPAVTFSVWSY